MDRAQQEPSTELVRPSVGAQAAEALDSIECVLFLLRRGFLEPPSTALRRDSFGQVVT